MSEKLNGRPDYAKASFLTSAHALSQLPPLELPEIAFAGRSNVGKSSLINRLLNRRNLVKTSGKPGKTRSLNYFEVPGSLYLVDLPGYGYAQVSKQMQQQWQELITAYLESRMTLKVVVLIIDLRHAVKATDLELFSWLRLKNIPVLPVYTKMDKLSGNERQRMAASLDAGFRVRPDERVLFSAKTGEGLESLLNCLDSFIR